LKTTDEGLDALIRLSQGDMRKALNILQSTSMAFEKVDASSVYVCTATPLPKDIENMVSWMLTETIEQAFYRASRGRARWKRSLAS
jgi:replication factor C subunit 3/5